MIPSPCGQPSSKQMSNREPSGKKCVPCWCTPRFQLWHHKSSPVRCLNFSGADKVMKPASDSVCGYSILPFHEAFQHETRQNNRVHWATVFLPSVLAVHSSKTRSSALACFGPECMSIHLNHPAQIQTDQERKEDPFVLQLVRPIWMLSLLAPLQAPGAEARALLMPVEVQAKELSGQISRCSAPAAMLSPVALMTGLSLLIWRPHSPLLPNAQLWNRFLQARRSSPLWRMLRHFLSWDECKVLLMEIQHPRILRPVLLPGLPTLLPLSLLYWLRKALIQASATHSYHLQPWCWYHLLVRLGRQGRRENEYHGCRRGAARAILHAERFCSRTQELHTKFKLLRLALL
jgi:hypothetical protein